jgi:hypothetical protein
MPYKEKLKNPSLKPRKKPQYKVVNWTEYNKILKKRRELSLYFPRGDLRPQFINEDPYVRGIPVQQATYKQLYIELVYMFYRLFGWGMRQITGFLKTFGERKSFIFRFPALAI